MATYKGIKGFRIQNLSSDAIVSRALGGTWASGGNLIQPKIAMGGAGIQTAGLVFGGNLSPSPAGIATTESYDGSSWSEVNDLGTGTRRLAGVGTQSLAAAFGGVDAPGSTINTVNEWNGTSWATNPNNYPAAHYSMAAAGTATAAIITGGDPAETLVNTFNGTSFTEGTVLNTGRRGHMAAGTTTAAIVAGGETPATANTEFWNGSAWTETANLSQVTQDLSGWGTSTDAMSAMGYGGSPAGNVAEAQYWDGFTWTAMEDCATARNSTQIGGIGASSEAGLVTGGGAPSYSQATEEWTAPATFTQFNIGQLYYNSDASSGALKVVGQGTGAWATGGTVTTARKDTSGAGSSTAGIIVGGTPPTTGKAELYDGTSWTETGDLNTARRALTSTGLQGTTLALGGGEADGYLDLVELFNGSAWSETHELNTARGHKPASCGTSTAALFFAGGEAPSATHSDQTESFNGSSWTEEPDLNTAGFMTAGGGSQSSAFIAGGTNRPAKAETWDGSTWTEITDINTGRGVLMGTAYSNTSAMIVGGDPARTVNEYWDGSTWTELADLATGRAGGGASTSTTVGTGTAFVASGELANSSSTPTSEEWTVPTAVVTVTAT